MPSRVRSAWRGNTIVSQQGAFALQTFTHGTARAVNLNVQAVVEDGYQQPPERQHMNFKTLTATALIAGLFSAGAFAQPATPTTPAAPATPAASAAKSPVIAADKAAVKADKEKLATDKAVNAPAATIKADKEQLKTDKTKAKKDRAAARSTKMAKPAAAAQ
jgi:hypothetical protein